MEDSNDGKCKHIIRNEVSKDFGKECGRNTRLNSIFCNHHIMYHDDPNKIDFVECEFILRSGPNRQLKCGRKVRENNTYCLQHEEMINSINNRKPREGKNTYYF